MGIMVSLTDFSIFISLHQANSIERKYLFRCRLKNAITQGCSVTLIYDDSSNLKTRICEISRDNTLSNGKYPRYWAK